MSNDKKTQDSIPATPDSAEDVDSSRGWWDILLSTLYLIPQSVIDYISRNVPEFFVRLFFSIRPLKHSDSKSVMAITQGPAVSWLLGRKFQLQIDSRAILSQKETPNSGDPLKQETVALAALASFAAYDTELDPYNFPQALGETDANTKGESMARAYRKAVIEMPSGACPKGLPQTEKDVVDALTRKGFNIHKMPNTTICSLATFMDGPGILNTTNRYFVIAFRGTIVPATKIFPWIRTRDISNCLDATQSIFTLNKNAEPPKDQSLPAVHRGFFYKALDALPDLTSFVARAIGKGTHESQRLIITGHSQGAANALALAAAIRHADKGKGELALNRMDLVTFAQPSLGNQAFAKYCINELKLGDSSENYLRFVREGDIVALVPGVLWGATLGTEEVAAHFGAMQFQSTGLNPVLRLDTDDLDVKEFIRQVGEAHSAAQYLLWAYKYAPNFVQRL